MYLKSFCSCDSWHEGVEAACVIGGGVNRASVSLFSSHTGASVCGYTFTDAMYICVCVCWGPSSPRFSPSDAMSSDVGATWSRHIMCTECKLASGSRGTRMFVVFAVNRLKMIRLQREKKALSISYFRFTHPVDADSTQSIFLHVVRSVWSKRFSWATEKTRN